MNSLDAQGQNLTCSSMPCCMCELILMLANIRSKYVSSLSQDEEAVEPEEGQSNASSSNDGEDGAEEEEEFDPVDQWHPKNPYQVRMDLPDVLCDALF